MKYYNQTTLCLEANEFIKSVNNPNGLVPEGTYKSLQQRNKIVVYGRGGNGRQVLIEYETMPELYKNLVINVYGDPYKYAALEPLRLLIKPDVKAIEFFDRYELPDGRLLKDELKRRYIKQAAIMGMIDFSYLNKKWLKKEIKIGLSQLFEVIVKMKEAKDCGLHISSRKLIDRYNKWKTNKYEGLISGRVGNQNRAKVTPQLEKLILSLYVQENKPYAQDALDDFNAFMNGTKEIVDIESGELLYPVMFLDKNGETIELSKTTVWNIINNPTNKIIVDKLRLSSLEFNNRHRPYASRYAPMFAFSKLTMDDRSIPFKMEDGSRAWTYIIADVASQCIVGRSYSRSSEDGSGKNRELFASAMNNMFRLMVNNGFGMPAEIEVEHHISNTFTGKINDEGVFAPDLLTNDYLFPFVTFCNPANPQQKRAEHIIRQIKYQFEKNIDGFQGRPFAKQDANRLNSDKKSTRYSFNEIVANIEAVINEWNNQMHPDQNKYAGLTRWQVLEQHQNPQLTKPYLPAIAKYIGISRPSTINRTEVKAFNKKFIVPASMLKNNTTVNAFAIPDKTGVINEIYLYEGDEFLCTATDKGAFNESKTERTERDELNRRVQGEHTAKFDAIVKNRTAELQKLAVIKTMPLVKTNAVETVANVKEDAIEYNAFDDSYWNERAINDL
ncbi:MAG: hypothetical protein JST94_11940 [Bacteroidetes bacterium]|nr:hypothetical protein [Bacteroidota bacterium]MBS1672137.1 hypothetical protein [Bacteroidota bacterium]